MKAKTHQVSINGKTHLVQAMTKAGAVRDVVEELAKQMRATAVVDLATGEQIYSAGVNGDPIIGSDRFKNNADPNQIPLAGIPETAGALL